MPRTKTPKNTASKSDFIREQPVTMSPVEIVAKAKAEGIKVSRALVYMVRGLSQGKGKAKKTSTVKPGAPAAKTVTNKSAFVRANRNLSPKEIVEKAKAAGLKLDIRYVYNVRGAAKTAAKKKRAAAQSPAVTPATNGGGSRVSTSAENLLKAVAAEIGLGPAIEILQGERGRVATILRG